MGKYDKLSDELVSRIETEAGNGSRTDYSCRDEEIIRRLPEKDRANLWRPAFVRDIEKIMHSIYYNRYADKTQVFSFYKNDDITRRALHVQLVSRISRNIGRLLGLNLDLLEAVALGHDIGHTPFGHAGERFLSALYHERTGRYFNHNVHSVRVLDKLIPYNISLQTLNGILCHNGEFELSEYRPVDLTDFDAFDNMVESCCADEKQIEGLVPCTLEGCVVRLSDIIAYLGKDRQDALRAKVIAADTGFAAGAIGSMNAEMINNLVVNVIENSYGKPYLCLDKEYFEALGQAKKENYEIIYQNKAVEADYQDSIRPMMEKLYIRLLTDLKEGNENSVVFRHHIRFLEESLNTSYQRKKSYREEEANQIIVDYIASMTDDYFVDLFHYLYPKSRYRIDYVGYFAE